MFGTTHSSAVIPLCRQGVSDHRHHRCGDCGPGRGAAGVLLLPPLLLAGQEEDEEGDGAQASAHRFGGADVRLELFNFAIPGSFFLSGTEGG